MQPDAIFNSIPADNSDNTDLTLTRQYNWTPPMQLIISILTVALAHDNMVL